MIGKPFINTVLSHAIECYLKYKEKPEEPIFSSFPVMVIRTLIFIYGELDIINPYITQNEHNMGGFDNNITKFGFSKESLQDFKDLFLSFQKEEEEKHYPNVSFLKLEKYLIDMFFCKKKMMNLSKEVQDNFCEYLYLESNPNLIIQQDLQRFCIQKNELNLYFQSVSYETLHNFSIEEIRRSTLLPEAYVLLGYSMDQIFQLNDMDLRKVNQQVYQFFQVDSNLPDKDELLVKAVNYYKKYGNRITSGNGYVDFLLFASVFATVLFITILFAFHL